MVMVVALHVPSKICLPAKEWIHLHRIRMFAPKSAEIVLWTAWDPPWSNAMTAMLYQTMDAVVTA